MQPHIHPLTGRSAGQGQLLPHRGDTSPAVPSLTWAFKCFQKPKGLHRLAQVPTPAPESFLPQHRPQPDSALHAATRPPALFSCQTRRHSHQENQVTYARSQEIKNLFLKYHAHFTRTLLHPPSLTMKILSFRFPHSGVAYY